MGAVAAAAPSRIICVEFHFGAVGNLRFSLFLIFFGLTSELRDE